MDQDLNLAPALERVTASVAETQRRRLELEHELGEAQHVIATLKKQSSALESSLRDLQQQLNTTLRAKSDEDSALAEVAKQKEAALQDLAGLRASIDHLLAEKERTNEQVTAAFSDVRLRIEALQSNLQSTGKASAAMAGEVASLRDRLAALREVTESTDLQLADVQHKNSAVSDAVSLLFADAQQLVGTLDDIRKRKQEADAAGMQLQNLVGDLQQQCDEAERAAESMRQVVESRRQHTEALSAQVQAMAQLVGSTPVSSAGAKQRVTVLPPRGNGAQTTPVASEASEAPAAPADKNQTETPFQRSQATVRLLTSEHFLAAEEGARVLGLLDAGEVNKVVRSLWSRAVGGATPGVYRLIIADALNESGDFKAAMTFYNQALATRQLDPFLIYLVGSSLFTAAKSDDALKLAKLLARDKAGKVLSRNIEAIHYMRSGKLDEAERRLSEALATPGCAPTHYHETLFNMAALHMRKGDTAAAMTWYEKLNAAKPGYRDTGQAPAAPLPAAH